MKTHDFTHWYFHLSDRTRHGREPFMQLHENHYIKRAGVAGVRERAVGLNGADRTNLEELAGQDGVDLASLVRC